MPPTDAKQRITELVTLNALAQTLNRASDLRDALAEATTGCHRWLHRRSQEVPRAP